MWANSCWGLLGLAAAFGLAMVGLSPDYEWLRPYFATAAIGFGLASAVCFCWPLRHRHNRVKMLEALRHPARWAANSVEPWHVIIACLIVAAGAVIWQLRRPTSTDSALQSELRLAKQEIERLKRERIVTPPSVPRTNPNVAPSDKVEIAPCRSDERPSVYPFDIERAKAPVPTEPIDKSKRYHLSEIKNRLEALDRFDDVLLKHSIKEVIPYGNDIWPAPGSADTELGVLMEPEVSHGKAEVYTRVQA
jgi:hypothetical protein